MTNPIARKLLTPPLLKTMVKWESKVKKRDASIYNTMVEIAVRATFFIALAVTQISDWLVVTSLGLLHLFFGFFRARSLQRAKFSAKVFFPTILNFPLVQAAAFRQIFRSCIAFLSPEGQVYSFQDWHNHQLRLEFLPYYIGKLQKGKRSHACFLCRSRFVGAKYRMGNFFLPNILLWRVFLAPIGTILDLATSFVFIPITIIRSLLGYTPRVRVLHSFYNFIYQIDLVFARIACVLRRFSNVVTLTDYFGDPQNPLLILPHLDPKKHSAYLLGTLDFPGASLGL